MREHTEKKASRGAEIHPGTHKQTHTQKLGVWANINAFNKVHAGRHQQVEATARRFGRLRGFRAAFGTARLLITERSE